MVTQIMRENTYKSYVWVKYSEYINNPYNKKRNQFKND